MRGRTVEAEAPHPAEFERVPSFIISSLGLSLLLSACGPTSGGTVVGMDATPNATPAPGRKDATSARCSGRRERAYIRIKTTSQGDRERRHLLAVAIDVVCDGGRDHCSVRPGLDTGHAIRM
jgi:hypothetical protein